MGIFGKWLSRNLKVALGMLGVALCLLVFSLLGNVLGQQTTSHPEKSEVASDKSAKVSVETKRQRWTIICEREDGTQGVFRILSNLTDETSPLERTPHAELGETTKESSSQEMEDETPAILDEDPFGNPTLHCGRLLTLLALFGTEDTSTL